jgi:uncharacterized membrane protein
LFVCLLFVLFCFALLLFFCVESFPCCSSFLIFCVVIALFVFRIRISKKNRKKKWLKEKVQKDKKISTKHIYKTKDRVTRTPLKTRGEIWCPGRVSSSCSTKDSHCNIEIIYFKLIYTIPTRLLPNLTILITGPVYPS